MYRIYLSPPSQNGTEAQALLDCLESNWLAPVGPHLDAFEHNLSKLHQNKPVLALNSGTSAIHLALKLLDVKSGDTVIVASHTHNATVNPIIYQGAHPVFVDSEMKTWNISPEFLHEAILDLSEKGIKPKAIIIVHLYGASANLREILLIARQNSIPVIEDGAEALGAMYQGKPLGTFGEFGILSFNGNKIVSSGGGGALICQTEEQRNKALYYATQARENAPHFEHREIGYNYRMSNVLAALGNAQLSDLQHRVKRRREIFEHYKKAFSEINQKLEDECISWVDEDENTFSNRWLSAFLFKPVKGTNRESIRLLLESKGIESRPLWKPMHQQHVFQAYPFYGNGASDFLFDHGLCLPSGNDLRKEEQDEIIEVIRTQYLITS